MLVELAFELCSKGLLLAVLVDVHDTVFDEKLWVEGKLRELWCMMLAVWERRSGTWPAQLMVQRF